MPASWVGAPAAPQPRAGSQIKEAPSTARSRSPTNRGVPRVHRSVPERQLPDHLGGGTIAVRLHGNDDDTKRRFNRTENIRPIPMTDPDFKALYRRRNDAESINRALDDTMWLRRAHSVGHERQHLNLLTHALGVNSLALWRHRHTQGEPPLPLAA